MGFFFFKLCKNKVEHLFPSVEMYRRASMQVLGAVSPSRVRPEGNVEWPSILTFPPQPQVPHSLPLQNFHNIPLSTSAIIYFKYSLLTYS